MSDHEKKAAELDPLDDLPLDDLSLDDPPSGDATAVLAEQIQTRRRENQRWWLKLLVQPLLFLAVGISLIAGLALAQKLGYLVTDSAGSSADGENKVRYICPMMCTPPQTEPGRCPTCAMELVPATSGGAEGGSTSIEIAPSARRIANIRTVRAEEQAATRVIRAIGEINYDESTLKTLSAYVDGRLDSLYADYTGVVVEKGDHLALVFSPKLYSSQAEFLLARKARDQSRSATLQRVVESNRKLYDDAKQRLIELGMTREQISKLEKTGVASRQLHLCAPISGTVIEKLAVEGEYVKEGQPIYRLADLSTVWLMLELFPEDAASIRYGQRVTATVQSLPGKTFEGRVAFIDPHVDPKTRTVGVRVVIDNESGSLRVGDYAKANINVAVQPADGMVAIYDEDLANKWISPRHPHVVRDSAGDCPHCGVALVPATEFGFLEKPVETPMSIVIPRDAVLTAGDNSVVYVEEEYGRFEIRRVVLGPTCGDRIVVLDGIEAGEHVATRGNFLIDSQMQLAGNPSLIDPTKAQPVEMEMFTEEMLAQIAKLSPDDRELAKSQRYCPVTEKLLGSMGVPTKVNVGDTEIFICCKGCESRLKDDSGTYLAWLESLHQDEEEEKKIAIELDKLAPMDRTSAREQRVCPVADYRLGSMGPPIKVDVNGKAVFICCEGCREALLDTPDHYLAKLSRSDSGTPTSSDSDSGATASELPPIGDIQILDTDDGVPPIGEIESLDSDDDLPPIVTPQPLEDETREIVR